MKKTILFQGDSITDCGRDRNDNGSMGSGYANFVKAKIDADSPYEYDFYNRGIGGNKITDLFSRINGDVINLKPDYMSVHVGINDVWHDLAWANGTNFDRFEQLYDFYIEDIKKALPDVKIMIMEPFVLKGCNTVKEDDPEYWIRMNEGVRKNAQAARRVAQKHGLKFIELQKIFDEVATTGQEYYWLGDGVHPSPAGHELIKREWLKAFEEIK